jgi:hypothetical protein
MRHGSAIVEEQMDAETVQDAPLALPDAQTLGRRLLAFARIASAMHAEAAAQSETIHADESDLSLASLLRVQS